MNIITDLCGVSSPLFSAGVCISLKIVCTDIRTYRTAHIRTYIEKQ